MVFLFLLVKYSLLLIERLPVAKPALMVWCELSIAHLWGHCSLHSHHRSVEGFLSDSSQLS